MAASARIEELRKRYDENQRRFFAPLANEYRKAGDLEQAIALCRLHLPAAPANVSGQIVFGQALFEAGEFEESRLAFEAAIGLDPENLIALRHLGDVARLQNDIPRARMWYQRVLDADRRDEDVLALMAELGAADAPMGAVAEPSAPGATPSASEVITLVTGAVAAPIVPSMASLIGIESSAMDSAPNADETASQASGTALGLEPTSFDGGRDDAGPEPESAPGDSHDPAPLVDMEFAPSPPPPPPPEPEPEPDSVPETISAELVESAYEPVAAPAAEWVQDEIHEGLDLELTGLDLDADLAASDQDDTHPAGVGDEGLAPAADDFGAVELGSVDLGGLELGEVELDMAPPAVEATPPISAIDADALAADDLGLVEAMPRLSQHLPSASGASYGFDLDLGAATDIPLAADTPTESSAPADPDRGVPDDSVSDVSTFDTSLGDVSGGDTPADPSTVQFGLVDVPDDRAFGDVDAESDGDDTPDPLLDLIPEPTPEIGVELDSANVAAVTPVVAPAALTPVDSLGALRDMPAPIVPRTPVEVFATETMAELYVRQGLRHEAIGVYRQLIAARPDDADLRAKLASLEAPPPPAAAATARTFFAGLASRRAAPALHHFHIL